MTYYEEIGEYSRPLLADAISSDDVSRICSSLVAMAFKENDWAWAQNTALDLMEHASSDVKKVAIVSIGHIARIYKRIELGRVKSKLMSLEKDPELHGYAEEALSDIRIFVDTDWVE